MTLKENLKKYPNDFDLGKFFFSYYQVLDDINEKLSSKIIKEHPNYYELGAYLRNKLNLGTD